MLDFDGNYLGGAEPPPYEWPIHACIMQRASRRHECLPYPFEMERAFQRSEAGAAADSYVRRVSASPAARRSIPAAGLISPVERGQALAEL